MLGGLLITFALVSNCADYLKMFRGDEPTKAIVHTPQIVSDDLQKVFRMPSKMDGLVAVLHRGKNLRVYGVVNADHTGFERFEFWGFERFPIPLMTVAATGVIQKFAADHLIVTAIVDTPRFEKLLIERRIISQYERDQKWKLKVMAYESIDEEIAKADHVPIWGEIYRVLHENRLQQEFKSEAQVGKKHTTIFKTTVQQSAAVPEPENREARTIDFGGWLPEQHTAAVIFQHRSVSGGLGLKIFLHPKFKTAFDPAFPDLSQRINLERRFELKWLGLQNPTVIETEATVIREGNSEQGISPVLSDNMIMVFEAGSSLPARLPFYRLDPETGLRVSGRQMLAAPIR